MEASAKVTIRPYRPEDRALVLALLGADLHPDAPGLRVQVAEEGVLREAGPRVHEVVGVRCQRRS